MSKVIRLTESDLVKIVKKVISEQIASLNPSKISNDWMTNLKNAGKNQSVCPIGFRQMTQQEISSYSKKLIKPWANTTDGTGDYIYKNANTICKRVIPRGEAKNPFEGLTLEQVANGFRDAISGVGGSIAQIIITLVGGHVINMVAWGLLVAYDIYSWVKTGVANWFNIINDLIWLLLAGVGGKIMGALKPILKGETKLINIFTKASKTTSWVHLKLFLTKISSYGSMVISRIRQALSAIINKVPTLKSLLNPLLGIINRVGGVLTRIEQTFVEFSKIKPVMKVAKVVKPVMTVAKVVKPMVKPVVKVAKEYVKGDIQSRAVNAGLNAGFNKT